MTVKIIAENQIKESHFQSATEQDGIYIGQPKADSGNTGDLRPITSGDENGTINDFIYNGTINGYAITTEYMGFEGLFTAGLCQEWSKVGASQTYEEETTEVHEGRRAQKITCVDDGEPIGVSNSYITTNGYTHYISAWVYCNEATTVTIAHANLTGGSETFAVDAETWTQCVWEVVATASGAAACEIYRAIGDSDIGDYIIIDDVVMIDLQKTRGYDSVLKFFDDDSLIGATIEFTSGTNDGESFTVNDNSGISGRISWPVTTTDFVRPGDTYRLTITAATLDMELELMTSGDTGAAKFKWSMDGGDNYVAREYSPTGYEHDEIMSTSASTSGAMIILETGEVDLLAVYTNGDDEVVYRKSTDQGVSWGAETVIGDATTYYLYDAIVLEESRRILVFAGLGAGSGTAIFYSDTNGNTWSDAITVDPDLKCVIELPNKNLLGFNDENSDIRCQISTDEGNTWGEEVVIVQEANDQLHPSAVLMANGDILCVYDTDEDSATNPEIKGKISSDYGTTWGAAIDILDYAGGLACQKPWAVRYPNGNIYVYFIKELSAGNYKIIGFSTNTDNGVTWTPLASTIFIYDQNYDYESVRVNVTYGRSLWVSYVDDGGYLKAHHTFRHRIPSGDSSLYGVVCAVNNIKQGLVCDINVQWHGRGGVAGDKWTFTPEWVFGMKNIISNSPNRVWRSITDNAECNILLKIGDGWEQYYVDGVAFFGMNFWDLNFQMHSVDSWGTPTVSADVQTTLATGTIDAVGANHVTDAELLANYKDHELSGLYFMATSGTDSGVSWKIRDNVSDYIILEETGSHSMGVGNTFRIYGTKAAAMMTAGRVQYIRVNIPAQHTPDDYYQIGTMVAGRVITLEKAWSIGYNKTIVSGVEYIRPAHGGMIPFERKDTKRVFQVSWSGSQETARQAEALFDYLKGKNLALIPDDTDLTDIYLCKIVGNLELKQWFGDRYNFSLTFEEI